MSGNPFRKPLKHSFAARWAACGLALAVMAATGFLLYDVWQGEDENYAAAFAQTDGQSKLEALFDQWRQRHEAKGGDSNILMGLSWSKAYSKEFSRAVGLARLDLIDGKVEVEIRDLDIELGDVWVVENQPGEGRSDMPEQGDRMVRLGSLQSQGERGLMSADVGGLFEDLLIDLVVVTGPGATPDEQGVLFGSFSLFQRLYTRARLGRLPNSGSQSMLTPVHASVLVPSFDLLIMRGAELFAEETFKGNGRTCTTCHPLDNNTTIDPEFIATLPANDKLFVAEFEPALMENFEKPRLMRKAGLILENTNGFENLETNFTMRGVPFTLGLPLSLTPAPPVDPNDPFERVDGTTVPPEERTGWSGDGSPPPGTLRNFANGAIRQHFTKTLNREPGVDFRFATADELDAMEAFQLFLGRDEELDLSTLEVKDPKAARGLELFLNEGQCNACHANAGANVGSGQNFNFNTGVEDLVDSLGDLIDPANNPPDDGFGDPGNGTFNTPSIVEAADTGPFFHNNAVMTIEGAVAFYNSDAFNNSPSGQFLGGIDLEASQVVAIAAFLRVINASENLRAAEENVRFVLNTNSFEATKVLLGFAIAEVEDAIDVLDCGNLHPFVVKALKRVDLLLRRARKADTLEKRDDLLFRALELIEKADGALVM